jgi:hypothetical protein
MSKSKTKALRKAAKRLGLPVLEIKLKKCKAKDFIGFPVPRSWAHIPTPRSSPGIGKSEPITFFDELPQCDKKTTEQIYEALYRAKPDHRPHPIDPLGLVRVWKQTSATTWTWMHWEVTFHEIAGLYSVAYKGKQIPMMPFEELGQAQAYCE